MSIAQWPHYGFSGYTGCSDIKTTYILLTTLQFFWLSPLYKNPIALKIHLRYGLHFHYQASRGIFYTWYSSLDPQLSLVGKIWPKAIYYSKKVEFLTINCIFEGLLSATELEQSSKETLDYVAHLTWIHVSNSQRFRKTVLKRFGTLP